MSELGTSMLAITPLGSNVAQHDEIGSFEIAEITDLSLASYAARLGQEERASQHLAGFIGDEAPQPGRLCQAAEKGAFWIGPDQWMVFAPYQSHENLAALVQDECAGSASITEQSDAWCCFELLGGDLSIVFERLCAADIRSCTGGETIRTSIEHLGCFVLVIRRDLIRVLGPRSSATSLHHAFITALKAVA